MPWRRRSGIRAARRAAHQVATEAVGTAHGEVEATDRDRGRAEDRRQGPVIFDVVGTTSGVLDQDRDGGVDQVDRVVAAGIGRILSGTPRDRVSAAGAFRAGRPALHATGRCLGAGSGWPAPPCV